MLKLYNELQPITKLATHPHIQYVIHHYFSAIPSHDKLIYKTYKCELYILLLFLCKEHFFAINSLK